MFRTIAIAATLTAVPGAAAAADHVITFEEAGLVGMANVPGSAVTGASALSDFFRASLGVSFSSGAGYVAVVDHAYPTASFPNIIGGTNADGTMNYASPITISFFGASNTAGVTNYVKTQGDYFPFGSGTVTLSAFDASGALLGTSSDTDDKAYGVAGPSLEFAHADIHSITLSASNGTVGFDNLEFNTVTTAPVPEPGAWAMMLAGIAVAGAASRRRRSFAA